MKIRTELPQLIDDIGRLGQPRILVPTMGALHEGHRALIKRAKELAGDQGSVILTLFVNPTQFDKTEDLEHYPRTLEGDLKISEDDGVDLVFTPNSEEMYHSDRSINVIESSLSKQLCGATRPGHFDGVCTVVLKLFNLTQPDIAIFGKKDYQQLAIIRRMVRDLNIPVTIEGVETVRHSSGLALSSRNSRLNNTQKNDAPRIRRALLEAQEEFENGEVSTKKLIKAAREKIQVSQEVSSIDYLEILDAESLQPLDTINKPAILATAVFYGDVRLIDNIEL